MNLMDLSLEQLQTYQPEQTKKKDFEQFWNDRKNESALQGLNIVIEPVSYYVPGVERYHVTFNGFRNSRIQATYLKPEKDVYPKSPAAVIFHGYNWNNLQPHYAFKYLIQGIPVMLVDVRGQNVHSPDHNQYKNGGSSGWMTLGITDPDNYYFSYVYMDCYRSVDVIRELSGKTDVFLEGGSQGGALAVATAALQDGISYLLADVPFLTHFKRSIEVSTEGPYNEMYHYFKLHDPLQKNRSAVFETLSYVDCMNLASLVSCPSFIGVGLEDKVCPPSSGFALYHHLGGEKQIQEYPEFGHELPAVHEEKKLQFIASRKKFKKE
ncbi:acetylxylan esterase [Peribacillus muralis]|uniref:acetylxylan esterase n=1 Tax=Peribacillus muralis TaxID=264697 RepID=UPI00367098C2